MFQQQGRTFSTKPGQSWYGKPICATTGATRAKNIKPAAGTGKDTRKPQLLHAKVKFCSHIDVMEITPIMKRTRVFALAGPR